MPIDTWPIEGDKIPKGYRGFLIFFDEFNSAARATQAAAYKIILDRYIGKHALHKNTVIICAGNRLIDNAIVNRMSTATQSRLAHFELVVDHKNWLIWAKQNNIDYRIMAHIDHMPTKLYVFDPNHNNKTFAAPRTWEFASRLISNYPGDLMPQIPLIASVIGEPAAREFIVYSKVFTELPTFNEIIADPLNIAVSSDPGVLYALSYAIAANLNKDSIASAMLYIHRLPIEFGTITLQTALKRDKELISTNPVQEWIKLKGTELF